MLSVLLVHGFTTFRKEPICASAGSSCSLSCCVATPALAQPTRDLEADQLADRLWWIIDITKQYQPPFQAHVTLEAPDGERVALTCHGESARTLIHDDVIALERKPGVHVDVPEQAMGEYFIPRLVKWGKPRWWSERASVARWQRDIGNYTGSRKRGRETAV